MAVSALFFNNLPRGITAPELREQFILICSTALGREVVEDVQVTVYDSTGDVKAVATGFCFDWESLKSVFRDAEIFCGVQRCRVNIKPDYGVARDKNGSIINTQTVALTRQLAMLTGDTHRRVVDVFLDSFREALHRSVFTGQSSSVFLNTTVFQRQEVMKIAGVDHVPIGKNIIRFHTVMELLQGMVLMNQNSQFTTSSNNPIQFNDKTRRWKSTVNLKCGLGVGGDVLSIYEINKQYGFIPIHLINPRFIDLAYIAKLRGSCGKCLSDYTIIGIHIDLHSFAGKCNCIYPSQEELAGVQLSKVAYRWKTELFTRLILGMMSSKKAQTIPLVIHHHPIKTHYKDPVEYGDIFLPLLEEDMFYQRKQFIENHSCTGLIYISRRLKRDNKETDIYALVVDVAKTSKAWEPGNPKSISNVKITWDNEFQKPASRTCTLFKMIEHESDAQMVRVFLQMNTTIKPCQPPLENCQLQLTPSPCCSENAVQTTLIKSWIKGFLEGKEQKGKEVLLNPYHCYESDGWELDLRLIKEKKVPDIKDLPIRLNRIRKELNEEQNCAFQKAVQNRLSMISGPPGTGKTLLLVSLIGTLAATEQGQILVCAPSNVAADGLATALHTFRSKWGFAKTSTIRSLRIYSKCREEEMYSSEQQYGRHGTINSPIFDTLHSQVRKRVLESEDKMIKTVGEKYYKAKGFTIPPSEMMNLGVTIFTQEKEIIKTYPVIICTVGALTDGARVKAWSQDGFNITTVILDEAGQVTQPAIIPLLDLNPVRVIFAGDPWQLRPTVASFAAEVAGLDKSVLEVFSWNTTSQRKNLPPWTELLQQYRMHPEICQIVSTLTYDGKLKNSNAVQRKPSSGLQHLHEFHADRRVIVHDHNFMEQADGSSYVNWGEAKFIVNAIQEVINKGVPGSEILVLTFYDSQKRLLTRLLRNEIVRVENVDSVQGNEAPVVYISFVRSNFNQDIGFVKSHNRLNVALSRAREFMFLVLSKNTFKSIQIQHIRKFMDLLPQ